MFKLQLILKNSKFRRREVLNSSKKEIEINRIKNSCDLYYEVALNEYSFERERKQGIETRAGVTLTVIGAAILVMMDKIDIKSIIDRMYEPFDFFDFLFVTTGALFYIALLGSVFFLFRVLSVKEYAEFPSAYLGEGYLKETEKVSKFVLIGRYKEILENHRLLNGIKAKNYNRAIYLVIILFLSLIVNINLG